MSLAKIKRLQLVARTKLVHRLLDLSAVVEKRRTRPATSGMQATQQNRLIADQQKRGVTAVTADEGLAESRPSFTSRLTTAVRRRHPIRRNRIHLGEQRLLVLVERHDRQPRAVSDIIGVILRKDLRGTDIRRHLLRQRRDLNIRPRHRLRLADITLAHFELLIHEKNASALVQRVVRGKHDMSSADQRTGTHSFIRVVPRTRAREVDVIQPELLVLRKRILKEAARESEPSLARRILREARQTFRRIRSFNPFGDAVRRIVEDRQRRRHGNTRNQHATYYITARFHRQIKALHPAGEMHPYDSLGIQGRRSKFVPIPRHAPSLIPSDESSPFISE